MPCASALVSGSAARSGPESLWRSRASLARPKSVTSARPSAAMRMFSGLTSRWTSPARCAATRPRPASSITFEISRQVRGSVSQVRRFTPSTSCMAQKIWPSASHSSWIATTLGWLSRAIAWASRRMRSAALSLTARMPRNLSATSRSSSGSRAAQTSPMAPRPRRRMRRKRPTAGVRAALRSTAVREPGAVSIDVAATPSAVAPSSSAARAETASRQRSQWWTCSSTRARSGPAGSRPAT